MNTKLLLFSIIALILIILSILKILKSGRMNIKYAIVWLLTFGLLLLLLIIPKLLNLITRLLGFSLSSNMILVFFIAILVFLNIITMIIISGQNEKIRLLIQEVSLIKKEVQEDGKKIK